MSLPRLTENFFKRLGTNGRRYRQARELADKAIRRRIRRLGPLPEVWRECPHLFRARGVGRVIGYSATPIFN